MSMPNFAARSASETDCFLIHLHIKRRPLLEAEMRLFVFNLFNNHLSVFLLYNLVKYSRSSDIEPATDQLQQNQQSAKLQGCSQRQPQ